MTGIIVKFKPALFELPKATTAEHEKIARKRSADDDEADAITPTEKKQKIEDDLTPSAVDTSTA